MMVDAYRVLTDPMTSYWRLDKSIMRFQKLLKYYPLNQSLKDKNIEMTSQLNVIKFIKKKIIQYSELIVVGFYAFNYYIKKISENNIIKTISFFEVISKDFEKDAKKIYNILLLKFNKKITTKEFYPFFAFMDKRIEYYYEGTLILRLFGNNNRCTVYNYSDKKHTHFGTYNLVFMYLLFDYFLAYINKDKINTDLYTSLISKLHNARNTYLDSRNITVLDVSPFQDFTFKCYGIPTDSIRASLLQGLSNMKQGKRYKFKYSPSGKAEYKIPEFNFSNSSGNQIINEKKMILKNIKLKK
jgi:hypothetical protein